MERQAPKKVIAAVARNRFDGRRNETKQRTVHPAYIRRGSKKHLAQAGCFLYNTNVDEIKKLETTQQPENPISPKEEEAPAPVVTPVTADNIQADLDATSLATQAQKEIISETTKKVNDIRHNLFGLSGEETDIPSIEPNKQKVEELAKKRLELEARLQEILKSDVSPHYQDAISRARESKKDWANSDEFTRRLKLKGATEEEISSIKRILIKNIINAKTFVLLPPKFDEVIAILKEMTGEDLSSGTAFHADAGEDVPDSLKNSIVLQEKIPPWPPLPGRENKKRTGGKIDEGDLHHELGHEAGRDLLEGKLYKKWEPKMKKDAPDPGYVGMIKETDTRIRSMYRDLAGDFEPGMGIFGRKQLEILKTKYEKGELSKDTIDLFEHYPVLEVVRLANRMPAI